MDIRVPEINSVMVSGRLTRDPELKYIPSGDAVCNIQLAINRSYKSGTEWKQQVTFIGCVAWKKTAEAVAKLHKGSPVVVQGSIESRSWETQDGQKRSVIELRIDRVQFLEVRSTGEAAPAAAQQADDDLPF